MRLLRKMGPLSIKKLAAELNRDYKNVYDDVQQLCQIDLVKKNANATVSVPWDDITIELNLAA
jgi:predicted transcriptional regulator